MANDARDSPRKSLDNVDKCQSSRISRLAVARSRSQRKEIQDVFFPRSSDWRLAESGPPPRRASLVGHGEPIERRARTQHPAAKDRDAPIGHGRAHDSRRGTHPSRECTHSAKAYPPTQGRRRRTKNQRAGSRSPAGRTSPVRAVHRVSVDASRPRARRKTVPPPEPRVVASIEARVRHARPARVQIEHPSNVEGDLRSRF